MHQNPETKVATFSYLKKKQKQIQQVLNFSKMALCIAKHQVVGIFGRQHSHIIT